LHFLRDVHPMHWWWSCQGINLVLPVLKEHLLSAQQMAE
jgi:hypothetical protein